MSDEWVIRRKSDGRYQDQDPYGGEQWVTEIQRACPLFGRASAERMLKELSEGYEIVERSLHADKQ